MALLRLREIPRRSFKAVPWKNGKGLTHEVAVHERQGQGQGNTRAPFAWRLSMAELAPPGGAFSMIDGVDRVLTLLQGDLALKVGAAAEFESLGTAQPFSFPGDVETDSVVRSKGLDLNVMHCRETISARVAVVCGSQDAAREVDSPLAEDDAVFVISLGDDNDTRGCSLSIEAETSCGSKAAAELGGLDAVEVCVGAGDGEKEEEEEEKEEEGAEASRRLALRVRGEGSALLVCFTRRQER